MKLNKGETTNRTYRFPLDIKQKLEELAADAHLTENLLIQHLVLEEYARRFKRARLGREGG